MNCDLVKRILQWGASFASLAGLWLMCAPLATSDGGGSRGGNPVVVGTIAGQDGAAARNVRVTLIPEAYDPLKDTLSRFSSIDMTDSLGSFTITAPDSGWYNMQAYGSLDGSRLIRFKIRAIWDSTLVLPADTLRRPGTIKVVPPAGSDSVGGYCYVPGTFIAAWIDGARDTVSLDSVPAGILPVLYYAQRNVIGEKAISYDIAVQSDDTTFIKNPEWTYSHRIILNTSSQSGASLSSDLYGFPVLIRLNAAHFDFTQTRSDGSDLKFTGNGNRSLPFEIQRWDPVAKLAEVWVKVDTIHGNDSAQFLTMYWGNPSAMIQSNAAAVFDTADGFQGVWHLDQDPVRDATANQFSGVSPDSGRPQISEGIIGNCRNFDGSRDFITMPNTVSGKLNFAEDGFFTVSAWVYVDTFDSTTTDYMYRTIASKGYKQYFLQLTSFPGYKPLWEFSNFREADKWCKSTSPALEKQWVLMTGVLQGSSQYLYCNGELVDSTTTNYQQIASRDSSEDFTIGRFFKEATFPVNGLCYFKGKIDEVTVSSRARSGDWIRLCYINQGSDDKLVQFK